MSILPEAKENFREATYSNLETSKKALNAGIDNIAFRRAIECGENVLKAVLQKDGKFIPAPPRQNGDWIHEGWVLFQKVKREKILPPQLNLAVENLVLDLFDLDVSSQSEHVDCASTGSNKLGIMRYLDDRKFIEREDAQEKIRIAEELVNILQPFV